MGLNCTFAWLNFFIIGKDPTCLLDSTQLRHYNDDYQYTIQIAHILKGMSTAINDCLINRMIMGMTLADNAIEVYNDGVGLEGL